jgi:dTDP-4-dehydrorhamnose 3,5-epimerase
MKILPTKIPEVLIIKPKIFNDERGYFAENWNEKIFKKSTGLDIKFVQENRSFSKKGVLRGLHYQIPKPQGKLVYVLTGKILDVVVDLRKSSPTFCKNISIELNHSNHQQLWIPPGFAHGIFVLSETAELFYKVTEHYDPHCEQCIKWDDKNLNIDWQLNGRTPLLSEKDKKGKNLKDAILFS